MDDDTRETFARLCTSVGMIMEDASVVALTISQMAPGRQTTALQDLEKASKKISALLDAARALRD